MCVYSQISDWGKGITPFHPTSPPYAPLPSWPPLGTEPFPFPWTHDSWAEYQELLKRASEVDAMLDQPDCEDPEKTAWMADVAAALAAADEDAPGDELMPAAENFSPSGTSSAANYDDENGNPAGGWVDGTGFTIDWQNGPLGRGEDRQAPNGAFVEELLWAVIQRIEYYQASPFNCRENALALTKCEEALHWLNARTAKREARNVEGTHAT